MDTILLASGDIFRIKYISQLLEKNYHVITSSRESEIIERLAQGVFKLMVLDGNLEVGESISVLRRVREAQKPIPVIMLVQSINSQLTKEASETGTFKILQIPFKDQELIRWTREGLAEEKNRLKSKFLTKTSGPANEILTETAIHNQPDLTNGSQYYNTILQQFSRALLHISNPKYLLTVLVNTVKTAFDVRKVTLLLYQAESGKFAIKESTWIDDDLTKNFLLKHENGLAAWMSQHQRILKKTDLDQSFSTPTDWQVKRDLEHLQAVIAIPLLAQGKLIGLLACGEKFTGDVFSRADFELFSIISTFFALIIKTGLILEDFYRRKDLNRTILNHLESAFVVVDRDKKIIAVNDAARNALSLAGEKLLFRPIDLLGDGPADIIEQTSASRQPVSKIKYVNPVNNQAIVLSTSISKDEHLYFLWINPRTQEPPQPENIWDPGINYMPGE